MHTRTASVQYCSSPRREMSHKPAGRSQVKRILGHLCWSPGRVSTGTSPGRVSEGTSVTCRPTFTQPLTSGKGKGVAVNTRGVSGAGLSSVPERRTGRPVMLFTAYSFLLSLALPPPHFVFFTTCLCSICKIILMCSICKII